MSNYHALSLLPIFTPVFPLDSPSENVAPGVCLNVGGGNWTHSAKKKLTTDVPRVELRNNHNHAGMQKVTGTWRFKSSKSFPFIQFNPVQFNTLNDLINIDNTMCIYSSGCFRASVPPRTSQQLHLFGSCASHGTLLWRRGAEHASKCRTTSDNDSKIFET